MPVLNSNTYRVNSSLKGEALKRKQESTTQYPEEEDFRLTSEEASIIGKHSTLQNHDTPSTVHLLKQLQEQSSLYSLQEDKFQDKGSVVANSSKRPAKP